MRLSWNEIRTRAAKFADDWREAAYEKGETQSFYNDFFGIFDVKRRSVARYEEQVQKLDNRSGFIDLFWPGLLIVEQKSAGRDLTHAYEQAQEYFDALPERARPRYILVSDFQSFELHDLDEREHSTFTLADLPAHVERFGFILGVQRRTFGDQDLVNIEAAELMGRLHDALKASGYRGHDLEMFLVRVVFCLFADDTGIFEPRDIFLELLEIRTREDGSDLGGWLARLFQVLNTPENQRQAMIDEDLARFPYVNGDLFAAQLTIPDFNAAMRTALVDACRFDWTAISPAIFGALFQSVMEPAERRTLGAHYTTEKNILKVIEPLFLDDLRAEFNRLRARKDSHRRAELTAFHERLGKMKFFDPACGCGNFLIIAYRELRELEIELLRELRRGRSGEMQQVLDTAVLSRVTVDQFYGIELGEFAARIAETALWMMDHIMNNRLSLAFGQSYVRIPLEGSPPIRNADALEVDWADVLPPEDCSFVFGNPPFVGHQWRTKAQQAGMARIWGTKGQLNRLDYVTCWFNKAMRYAADGQSTEIAFVATNSITQGEQAGVLWPVLFAGGVSIRFAHRTFQWNSEARGSAAVHCVIIGMTFATDRRKTIYDYDHVRGEPHLSEVTQINGYLIDGPQYAVRARSQTPVGRLKMHKGSQPTDGARRKKPEGGYITFSNLILDEEERGNLLATEPECEKWLKPFVGGDELISGKWRWCLWLKDAEPAELRASKAIRKRLDRVREGRLQSPTASVREYAKFPTLFTQDRQPVTPYLAIPAVSSETREYIPMAMLPPNVIASDQVRIIPGGTLLYLGILTSAMHMAWMRTVAGRLESRYRYSPAIYNSFVWPDMVDAQESRIVDLAQGILNTRAAHPDATLADLYDPDSMPPDLRKAHQTLDRAVDKLYRRTGFSSERERVEHLFMLYEKMSAPLQAAMQVKPKRRRAKGKSTKAVQ